MGEDHEEATTKPKASPSSPYRGGVEWSQPELWGPDSRRLWAPEQWEARLWVGAVPSADHMQLMVETYDPVSRVQHSRWSRPHAPLGRGREPYDEACDRLWQRLLDEVDPF